jgi:hypothetical protein
MPRLALSWKHQKYILVFRLVESLGDLGEQLSQVVIENPIINSPFDEPTRHFRFNDEGITDEEVAGRRVSSYFVPIAPSKKRNGNGKQAVFDTEWTQDRIEESKLVNDIRRRVATWRKGGYVGVTPTTARFGPARTGQNPNHEFSRFSTSRKSRRQQNNKVNSRQWGIEPIYRNPCPDGPARLPGFGHQEKHYRSQ